MRKLLRIQTKYYPSLGLCEAIVNGDTRSVEKHGIVFVRVGTRHNFKNTGGEDQNFFTLYALAEHADGTIYKTKADADNAGDKE